MANKTNDTDKTPRSTPSRARRVRPEPPDFNSAAAERSWHREQDRIDIELAEAAQRFPVGTKLHVTTKSLTSRARAGVRFTNQGRTEVEVVDLSDEDLAKVRGGDNSVLGTDEATGAPAPLAAKIRSAGMNAVSSMGAKQISEDDALIVYADPKSATAEEETENKVLTAKVASLEGEVSKLRAELSKRPTAPSKDGAPERLARNTGEPATKDGLGDFGGGDTGKAGK